MIDHQKTIADLELDGELPMLIDGELAGAARTLTSTDPTTGGELASFPCADESDVDRAVAAARRAFEGPWREMGPGRRAACLSRLAVLARERQKPLAKVESLDVGIPYSLAKKLTAGSLVKNLEYYASWADKVYGEVVPLTAPGAFDYTLREPYGVIASVIPWNTPLLFVGAKLGPALATGNVVILKPSEQASLSALKVAALVAEAGFPPGVIQIVTGDAQTGRALVRHPDVDRVSFTGGGAIARAILADLADGLTPASLELGGKSPNIVFADADLDKAGLLAAMGCFGLSGQACAAGSRLLVQRSVHDEVVDRIAAMAGTLSIGDPLDPSTLLGPLVSREHRASVEGHVRAATDDGAELRLEASLPGGLPDAGAFYAPRIFTGVAPTMRLFREEVFGPVMAVTPFDDEDEALALANDSEYGLAAGVWTKDGARAHRLASRLVAGTVWVNHYGMLPVTAPFGGAKHSGWGREGGRDALYEYTRTKNVFMDVS